MSETSMDSTGSGQEDDLEGGGHGHADGGADGVTSGDDGSADAGAGPVSDLDRGDDVSTGTDGVGGGNDSRSSVLQDTLGAGGNHDEGESDL